MGWLVSGLILSLLLPSLHLSLAPHCHRLDFETGQFLDIRSSSTGDEDLSTDAPTPDHRIASPASVSFDFSRCPVANGLSLRGLIHLGFAQEITGALVRTDSFNFTEVEHRPSLPVTVAPKQSPPTFV